MTIQTDVARAVHDALEDLVEALTQCKQVGIRAEFNIRIDWTNSEPAQLTHFIATIPLNLEETH